MKRLLVALVFVTGATVLFAKPVVDGKIGSGEYAYSVAAVGGSAEVYAASDGSGGYYFAVRTNGQGWVGLGLGAQQMSGAYIYLGYDRDGKTVFTEQKGHGHSHSDSGEKTTSQDAVITTTEGTVMEFHVPASRLPFQGKSVPAIVAFSNAKDTTSYHGDNYDILTLNLPN